MREQVLADFFELIAHIFKGVIRTRAQWASAPVGRWHSFWRWRHFLCRFVKGGGWLPIQKALIVLGNNAIEARFALFGKALVGRIVLHPE